MSLQTKLRWLWTETPQELVDWITSLYQDQVQIVYEESWSNP